MRPPAHALLGLCAALALGCTSDLAVEAAPAADLSAYRTWDWLPPGADDEERDSPLEIRFARLLEQRLADRGYERVRGGETPDFHLVYQASVEHSSVMRSMPSGQQQFHTSESGGAGTWLINRPSHRMHMHYEDALLIVGVSDARSGELVWRAERREEVRGDFADHLDKAVGEILGRWPVARAAPSDG